MRFSARECGPQKQEPGLQPSHHSSSDVADGKADPRVQRVAGRCAAIRPHHTRTRRQLCHYHLRADASAASVLAMCMRWSISSPKNIRSKAR